MGSGRTFDRSGESDGTGVLVLSCFGEGKTGGGELEHHYSLITSLLSRAHHLTTSLLTKLENILASGRFLVMLQVKGFLILELRLSVP